MKRLWLVLSLIALSVLPATSRVDAQTCAIGGHNETSENFTAAGGWTTSNMSPGVIVGAPSGSHLVISEVAARGAGTGAASDSSEYIEIYNPTSRPVSLDDKYVSDDIGYYRVVNGTYPATNTSDFALRFPAGLTLSPGRTLVLCVTKAGFAGSGASPGAAEHFLEMKDSNANPADDMVIMTTGSAFPVTGGNLTNPSTTNGEWVVLYCWNGTSDRVCDIDYASWGANSASNPKMDKTGISIDGPDAGALASAYNADTAAAGQTNLGTAALVKPNTYQRFGAEVGETAVGGNGCIGQVVVSSVNWVSVASPTGGRNIRFHIRWQNPDDDAESTPFSGQMFSQEFGVFLPDAGLIGDFTVPPMQPNSFFDVFFEVPLDLLPPPPQKILPGGGGGGAGAVGSLASAYAPGSPPRTNVDCPPDTNWAGNVDIVWTGSGQGGQVNKHYGDLLTCIGGAPSYIHFRGSNCTAPMPWSVVGVCPGYTVTLVNEDFSPAPNPVPVGWTGWISVSAAPGVTSGTSCCFSIVFQCLGASSTIDICSTACDCQVHPPTLTTVDWTTLGTTVRFRQHWENPSATNASDPVSGEMSSQHFGAFLPNFGPIGHFDIPPIAPSSFFDVFFDVPLANLPPNPAVQVPGGPPPVGSPCYMEDHWHGNVDVTWSGTGGSGQVNKHFGEMPVCPGSGPTNLFVETGCASPVGATWSIAGVCPGFTATLLNLDLSPAPNPVPPGWVGLISVSAAAAVPLGTMCCLTVNFMCDNVPGVIDVCVQACDCGRPKPQLQSTDWTRIGADVRFHMRWENTDPNGDSGPVSGDMMSQPFGAFAQNFGPIGHFDVPPIPPSSFFDVFLDVPLDQLPPEPEQILPDGGPQPGSPCPQDTSWSGNVDINWAGEGGTGAVNYHFTGLLVRPGSGSSHVHALIFCNSAAGAAWTIAGLCPGFSATLLNEDFTPAANPVPPNWTGWISVAADASVPVGTSCCFTVTFTCDGQAGVIDVCAETCTWGTTDVPLNPQGLSFGIVQTAPNPTTAGMTIAFVVPRSSRVSVGIYDLAGRRVTTLFTGAAEAGVQSLRWDGRDGGGRKLPPGTYFVKLQDGAQQASRKVVLTH